MFGTVYISLLAERRQYPVSEVYKHSLLLSEDESLLQKTGSCWFVSQRGGTATVRWLTLARATNHYAEGVR
jgi:hypothetical protein